MNEKIQKIINGKCGTVCDKFCNSVWYIVAMCVACIVCHTFDIPITGAVFISFLMVVALIFCKNSFTLVPFALLCSFVMSEETSPQSGYFNEAWKLAVLLIVLLILIAAFIFNLIYYGKWRYIFKRAYLTVSFCLVSGFLLVGGLFSPSYSVTGVGMSLAIAATMFVPYSMLVNCGEYNGGKAVKYVAWTLIGASVVIFCAVIKQYVIHNLNLSYHPKDLIRFGYAISNTAAAFVVIAMPLTFYMVYKSKFGFLYVFFVLLELVTVGLTFSRASLVVALPGVIIVATVLCFKKKSGRIGYWITYGLILIAGIVIFVVYRDIFMDKLKALFAGGISDSGRFGLWKVGFDAWKEYPIFGLNIWYLPPINNWYYSFHCTPLTYLYCTGIVGLAAYIYHRYKTVRLVFLAKLTSERVFSALAIFAMLCNALLDIAMTMPQHLLYYSVILALIEHDAIYVKNQKTEKREASSDITNDITHTTIQEGNL